MQYYEPIFFIFLTITLIVYSLIPKDKRWLVLLIASFIFFYSLSSFLIIYLLASILVIYLIGLKLEKLQITQKQEAKGLERNKRKELKQKYKKKQCLYIKLTVFLHIGLLVLLKYSNFIIENLNIFIFNNHSTIPMFKFLVPIGISFYSLQAISYIVDVYHGKIKADHKITRLALFMSFFPYIMEGPIVRYEQTAMDLYKGEPLKYENMKSSIIRYSYGLIKKMIVADRLNIIVKQIFDNYSLYDGGIMFLAMMAYTCQLYMEFSGTTDMIISIGQMFNVTIPENFKRPFFSKSISEFWSRWHITLGTFFKDYIYYPLSLSTPLRNLTKKARKTLGNYYGPLLSGAIALIVVWLCNGLWHGAAWSYIFFGIYHFVFIIGAKLLHPIIEKFYSITHINKNNPIMLFIRTIKTVFIVCVGELFFRAPTLEVGINMFIKMITNFTFNSFNNLTFLRLGLDVKDYILILIMVLLVLCISIIQEKNINIRNYILSRPLIIRWTIYYAIIILIIIFGAYGNGYTPVEPIYAGF